MEPLKYDDPEEILDYCQLGFPDFERLPQGEITLRGVTFKMRVGQHLKRPMQAIIALCRFVKMAAAPQYEAHKLVVLDPQNPDSCLYYPHHHYNGFSDNTWIGPRMLQWQPGMTKHEFELYSQLEMARQQHILQSQRQAAQQNQWWNNPHVGPASSGGLSNLTHQPASGGNSLTTAAGGGGGAAGSSGVWSSIFGQT